MPFSKGYTPWNKDRIVGQKRPFKLSEIEIIRTTLETTNRVRELAMFNLALDSKLRGSDLISLKIDDVCVRSKVRDRAVVAQKKTSAAVQFEIGARSRDALLAWIKHSGLEEGYLFPSSHRKGAPLTTRQYARIVDNWARIAGLEPDRYGTHTLRRTKVTLLYRKTGNLRAVQLLLGHKSIENTVRYLGVEVNDALELSEQMDF
jgi:integrase